MKDNTLTYFNEKIKDNKIICTDQELDSFLTAGLLFKTGNSYVTRNFKTINIDLIKPTESRFNLNLQHLISLCEQQAQENNIKKIFCMTEKTFDFYKNQGLIVTKDNKNYYRLFNEEFWLVYIV